MLSISFIFYGSLKVPERQETVLGRHAVKTLAGFIRGDLYVVTDHTDPYGVFKYPLVILKENGRLVTSVLVTLEIEEDEVVATLQRLKEYEGPLYCMVETIFYGVDGARDRGFVFAGMDDALDDPRVQRLPLREIYDWQDSN